MQKLCFTFPLLFYSKFPSRSLHYIQLYFHATTSIITPYTYLQFSYITNQQYKLFYSYIPELLKVLNSLSLMISLSVLNPECMVSISAFFFTHAQHHYHFMAVCFFRITNFNASSTVLQRLRYRHIQQLYYICNQANSYIIQASAHMIGCAHISKSLSCLGYNKLTLQLSIAGVSFIPFST